MEAPTNSRAGRPFAVDVLANSVVFLLRRVALLCFGIGFAVDLTTNSAVSPPSLAPPRTRRWLHFAMDVTATLPVLLLLLLGCFFP